jgi:hypothetical protein
LRSTCTRNLKKNLRSSSRQFGLVLGFIAKLSVLPADSFFCAGPQDWITCRKSSRLVVKDYHKILGLSPGATERQIKAAYRKMALRYHPDLNDAPDAQEKFHEINAAYEHLLERAGMTGEEGTYDDEMARVILRRQHQRMQEQARARREKKKREDEYFNRPEWHDPILMIKYTIHALGLLLAVAAIVVPVVMAVFNDPASLSGTFFFIVAGVVILVYIYQRRSNWFRLGKFITTWKELSGFLKMEPDRSTTDRCCYRPNAMAGGKPYRIELLKTVDVKTRSFGALDHQVSYNNKVKTVVLPRSSRAHFFHRISSLVKICTLLGCLLFFPVDSLLWRAIAGIAGGGFISAILLFIAGVRSKVSYLFTPGLILKAGIWIFALFKISILGPGFNIQVSGYVYLVVAGLLFLLDMLFDLVMGFFPFYRWLFRPVIRQGTILEGLYREGYQNYQELPVYSVLYPLFRWLF